MKRVELQIESSFHGNLVTNQNVADSTEVLQAAHICTTNQAALCKKQSTSVLIYRQGSYGIRHMSRLPGDPKYYSKQIYIQKSFQKGARRRQRPLKGWDRSRSEGFLACLSPLRRAKSSGHRCFVKNSTRSRFWCTSKKIRNVFQLEFSSRGSHAHEGASATSLLA